MTLSLSFPPPPSPPPLSHSSGFLGLDANMRNLVLLYATMFTSYGCNLLREDVIYRVNQNGAQYTHIHELTVREIANPFTNFKFMNCKLPTSNCSQMSANLLENNMIKTIDRIISEKSNREIILSPEQMMLGRHLPILETILLPELDFR